MSDRFFCSVVSKNAGEPIFATVAQNRTWLLLEYPSAWRRDAIHDSRLLPVEVKRRLPLLADRSLLIRRDHIRHEALRCFRVDCRAGTMTREIFDDYSALLSPAEREAVTAPLYAVCTHAKHDRCCAKFGLPVFCAFRDAAGSAAWQCSHIGGDRFAANVVVFPYGIYYGRIMPDEASEVIRRTESGEIWLERYRGRSIFPRVAQAAEYFARRESGLAAIGEFTDYEAERVSEGVTRVRFRSGHTVVVRIGQSSGSQLLTCSSALPAHVPEYRLVSYKAR